MKPLIFISLMIFPLVTTAQTCKVEEEVVDLLESCGDAYYRFTPYCRGGDGTCLSLYLYSLLRQDLFGYREDLRRDNYTPLKQKRFTKMNPKVIEAATDKMMEDYKDAIGTEFCARMETMWIYSLKDQSFSFPYDTLLSSRLNMYEKRNVIKVPERTAVDVEEWDGIARSKFAFFRLLPPLKKGGKIRYEYTRFVWVLGKTDFTEEGQVEIDNEESCTKLDGSGSSSFLLPVKQSP